MTSTTTTTVNEMPAPKSVLTISLSKHLTGEPIAEIIAKDWKNVGSRAQSFDNVGFDVDGDHFDQALEDLGDTLHKRDWDGIIVGWCLRGKPDRTVMFERVMGACIEASRKVPKTKIMFCTGPDNLAEATLRNFA